MVLLTIWVIGWISEGPRTGPGGFAFSFIAFLSLLSFVAFAFPPFSLISFPLVVVVAVRVVLWIVVILVLPFVSSFVPPLSSLVALAFLGDGHIL